MSSIQQDFDNFRVFVESHIDIGNAETSLDELFDSWRHENPSEALEMEDVAAVAAAIEDFKNGDRGTVAGEHSAELRREFGILKDDVRRS